MTLAFALSYAFNFFHVHSLTNHFFNSAINDTNHVKAAVMNTFASYDTFNDSVDTISKVSEAIFRTAILGVK